MFIITLKKSVLITYLGVIFAVISMYFAFSKMAFSEVSYLRYSLVFLMLAGICDMFDGKIARTKKNRTKNEKRFGIQIDSLSDVICFGILPATIGYNLGMKDHWYTIAICMLFALNALIRLAYFNVEEEDRQETSTGDREICTGLPVTPSAMIFPLTYLIGHISFLEDYFLWIYSIVMLLVAFLFVGNYHIFKKPKLKGVILVVVTGLVIFGLLMYIKYR